MALSSSAHQFLLFGDLSQHVAIAFYRRRLDRRGKNDRALFPGLQHEGHSEIEMTPFALVIPDDVDFVASCHSITMSLVNSQSDAVVGLVNITRWVVNGSAAMFQFGDITICDSAFLFASISHRTDEIDSHTLAFRL